MTSILFLAMYSSITAGYTILDEERLRTDLFASYDQSIRPPYNISQHLRINVSFFMSAIKDINDAKGTISTLGGFTFSWIDDRLMWNVSEYGGIREIVLQHGQTWLPSVIAMNAASLAFFEYQDTFLRLQSNGSIGWRFFTHVETSFKPDMTYFPHDTQICSIELSLIGYYPSEVALYNETQDIILDGYQTNKKWEVVDTEAKPLYIGPFSGMVQFKMELRRRHFYFDVMIMMPLSVFCVVYVVVFLVPIESGEKVSFAITLLPTFGVYLSEVSDNMPKVSTQMAYLSFYLVAILFGTAFSCVFSIAISSLYFKRQQPAPKPLTIIAHIISFQWLMRILERCQISQKKSDEKLKQTAWTETESYAVMSSQHASKKLNNIFFIYACLGVIVLHLFAIHAYFLR
ncbi:hypothetical protein FSP39_014052 [Pinctada imbricata]|uniref:Uncharacterized protein n=1 Tax=Pinctada imbricata TaxID=66713 RepID=A0AA88YJE8_PINIB|nr:hypothetical protein FSP39_014052 [Pinctada imbricata]